MVGHTMGVCRYESAMNTVGSIPLALDETLALEHQTPTQISR